MMNFPGSRLRVPTEGGGELIKQKKEVRAGEYRRGREVMQSERIVDSLAEVATSADER